MSPGRIRYEDLSPEVARKIAGRTGRVNRVREVTRKADRSNRSKDSGGRPASKGTGRGAVVRPEETAPRANDTPWRCHRCGETGTTLAGLYRHADTGRHYRFLTLW